MNISRRHIIQGLLTAVGLLAITAGTLTPKSAHALANHPAPKHYFTYRGRQIVFDQVPDGELSTYGKATPHSIFYYFDKTGQNIMGSAVGEIQAPLFEIAYNVDYTLDAVPTRQAIAIDICKVMQAAMKERLDALIDCVEKNGPQCNQIVIATRTAMTTLPADDPVHHTIGYSTFTHMSMSARTWHVPKGQQEVAIRPWSYVIHDFDSLQIDQGGLNFAAWMTRQWRQHIRQN